MEKNNLSELKKKMCVVDLTSDDKNLQASTSSYKPQIKRQRMNINERPLIIHRKDIVERYKYKQTSLNDVVEKIKIKKIDVPKTLPNKEITALYSKCDKVEKENPSTVSATNLEVPNTAVLSKNVDTEDITVLYSKCNITSKEIAPVNPPKNLDIKDIATSLFKRNVILQKHTPAISSTNLDTEDITVLYSKCNITNKEIAPVIPPKNLDTKDIATSLLKQNVILQKHTSAVSHTNLNAENTMDIINKNFNVSCDKLNKEMEEILSNTVKNPEILIQDHESYTWLTDNNSEKKDTFCSSHINICLLSNQILNGENVCRFYWWDAYENPSKRNVYLFGKVYIDSTKTSYSSCLTIKSVPRKIYLLPTKYLKNSLDGKTKITTKKDVCNEFDKLANNLGIHEFKSRWVSKKYVFQKDIFDDEEYLEIVYPAIYQNINSNYTGPAIEKIFHINLSSLKLLLLERNIKGPCWLNITNPMSDLSHPSWCRINIICKSIENISVSVLSSPSLPLPPMVVATINICTYLGDGIKQDQILMVVILLKDEYPFVEDAPNQLFKQTFCLITRPNGISWPFEVDQVFSNITNINIIKCEDETILLEKLLYILEKADPDLYIGYDSNSQLELLLRRMFSLNITNWYKVGKMKNFTYPCFKDKILMDRAVPGRAICDLKVLSLELNIKSNNLQSLSEQVLKTEYNQSKEIKCDNYFSYYSSGKHLEDFIEFTVAETRDISSITLELNIISFVIELTRISGYYLSKLLQSGQIKRNEFLLSHAFYANNYLLPDFQEKIPNRETGIKRPHYKGGLVLTPRTGFYNKLILLMDFISLYPNIIIEYNLCLSTVPGAACTDYQDLKIPESNSELGVIPKEMYKLIEYRKQMKEFMKLPCISSNLKVQYNTKQLTLKLMANSLYGCLGAPSCKFYAKGLAALITSKGREILSNTKSLIENMEHKVIYGDTDSVMIETDLLDYDKIISIGNKIKEEVNKSFKYIELDIDSVFRYLLLLQKKKYAALKMNKLPNGQIELSQIHKGLLITRRDWCPLSVQVGKDILNFILSDASNHMKNNAIHEILTNISRMIKKNNIPVSSFLISKQMSKNLNDYHDNDQPHVQVARRLYERSGRIWKAGDTISYVICKTESIEQKSYHINEFIEDESLKIDINYYLTKQLLPVVLTLCEPIMGMDKIWIIKSLANEETEFPSKNIKGRTITQDEFNHCKAFTFRCLNCETKITIENILSKSSNDCQLFLQTICSNDKCKTPLWKNAKTISDELQFNINQAIDMYDSNVLKCENPECINEIKWPSLHLLTKPKCNICKKSYLSRKYIESNLQDRIHFYRDIFDLSKLQNESLLDNCSKEVISTYNMLRDIVNKYIRRFSYSTVSLDKYFRYKFVKHSENDSDFDISLNDYIHVENDEQV